MFDMGPYYLTALVNLLGPVRRVTGSTALSFPTRTITSQPKAGKVVTRPADTAILRGITRDVLMHAIAAEGLTLEERSFSAAEAFDAREAFMTAATQTVMPIVSIDGKPLGDGRPGPVARALRKAFRQHAE